MFVVQVVGLSCNFDRPSTRSTIELGTRVCSSSAYTETVFYVVRSCACIVATPDNQQPRMFRFPCIGRYSPVPHIPAHGRHHSGPLPCVFPLSPFPVPLPVYGSGGHHSRHFAPAAGRGIARPVCCTVRSQPLMAAAGCAGAQSDSA